MFWERLYALCLQKGCKPNTVAKALGLSSATATKWKNGAVPNGEALKGIADYLNCSVDFLLGRTDIVDLLPHSGDEDETVRSLVVLYSQLNNEGREKLVEYADDMLRSGKYSEFQ